MWDAFGKRSGEAVCAFVVLVCTRRTFVTSFYLHRCSEQILLRLLDYEFARRGHWFFGVWRACVGVQGVYVRVTYAGMGVRGRATYAGMGVRRRAWAQCWACKPIIEISLVYSIVVQISNV